MKKPFRIFIIIYIITILFFYLGNNIINVTVIEVTDEKIPKAFNDYKIVQISDLHNKQFGKNQFTLLEKVKKQSPDVIVVTGDSIYKYSKEISHTLEFFKGAVKIAPVYFVTGNHEAQIDYYPEFLKSIINLGVHVLEDESIKLYLDDEYITLWGVNDPALYYNHRKPLPKEEILRNVFDNLHVNKDDYNILLSHRPHLIDLYNEFNFDLVFSGHAHGGQFILPFIGPIVAPDQGFFPKYTHGTYKKGNTTEIVSRGLGNSIIPLRLFNNPELIVCKLKSTKI